MFAPKVARAQTKAAESPAGKRVRQRSNFVVQPFRRRSVAQVLMLQRTIGNRATSRLLAQQTSSLTGNRPGGGHDQDALPLWATVQTKLNVGRADDPLEHEADRVADQVMHMPDPALSIASAPSAAKLSRKCAECEEQDEKLQRKPRAQANAAGTAPAIVHLALHAPGQPLSDETRAFMEPRFGQSFSSVRIHTGPLAADSATAVGALAYTVGRDIVFNTGQYAPSTEPGRKLLAHELVHVVQQNSLGNPAATSAPVTRATQPLVSRAPAPGHCGGAWTCSAIPCKQPDQAGDGTPSTSWQLDVNIDTDVEKSTDINFPADVGHGSVAFQESNGTKYTFGFYPQPNRPPDEFVSMVPGCVAHPDTTHDSCFDYTEHYTVTQQQYSDALAFAQAYCISPPKYALFTNNCATFVVDVAKRAGQNPPSPRGPVLSGTKQSDNPNTLKEGYLDLHIPTRSLTSDTKIREWVAAQSTSDIAALPTVEKIRLLNRLLDGWISDDDVAAFEKICGSVDTSAEQSALQKALGRREYSISNQDQRARIHKALFMVMDTSAPPSGTAQG